MADTLSQFRARIRRWLHEVNPQTSYWTPDFIDQMFNAAYRRRSSQLIMAFEGWFVQVATRDIEADKAAYGFPDGLQRLQKIEIVRSDGSTVPLERFERHDEVNPDPSTTLTGDSYLPNFRMFGNGIILEPTPNEDITEGLRIEYAGLPAYLSGAGDRLNPSFPELFDELLVLDTAVMALDAEGTHETGAASTVLRLRMEWEFDWERFIDQRTVSRDKIDPFIGPYRDA